MSSIRQTKLRYEPQKGDHKFSWVKPGKASQRKWHSNCILEVNRKSLLVSLLSICHHHALCSPLSSLNGFLSGSTFRAFAHAVSSAWSPCLLLLCVYLYLPFKSQLQCYSLELSLITPLSGPQLHCLLPCCSSHDILISSFIEDIKLFTSIFFTRSFVSHLHETSNWVNFVQCCISISFSALHPTGAQ